MPQPIQPEMTDRPTRPQRPHSWVKASGSPGTRHKKAAQYLKRFDHSEAAKFDAAELTFLKVVCNLRHYHCLDKEQCVTLIADLYAPKIDCLWSPEATRLAWDLVEDSAPSLGLSDGTARARWTSAEIEDAVIDLIAETLPGGRVLRDDLMGMFQSWYPDMQVTKRQFTVAVAVVTGIATTPVHGKRYFIGFHHPDLSPAITPVSTKRGRKPKSDTALVANSPAA